MNDLSRKKPGLPEPSTDAERRRMGRVVHDDRGNAWLSWCDAPADYDRPVLEVLGEPKLGIKSDETHDPYAHRAERSDGQGSADRGGGTRGSGKRDLRKLSEWIKMMREREQRKRGG